MSWYLHTSGTQDGKNEISVRFYHQDPEFMISSGLAIWERYCKTFLIKGPDEHFN